jgi:hypothetical protein
MDKADQGKIRIFSGKCDTPLMDNFKTLRFTIVKWSVQENIEQFRHVCSN